MQTETRSVVREPSVGRWATAIVLLLLGIPMAVGGVQLLMLGGSGYYLIAGAVLIVIALLLAARCAVAAAWLYAAFLFGSTVWAVAEVGFDWWPLVPRLWIWWLLGLWMLAPWSGTRPARYRARLLRPDAPAAEPPVAAGPITEDAGLRRRRRAACAGLGIAVALTAVAGIASLVVDRHDLNGTLALDRNVPQPPPIPAVAPGDWPSYGRTQLGDRYSPLTQITPANAGQLKQAWVLHTGDQRGPGDPIETTDENTPLKVGNTLFICTPHSKVLAVDATTGEVRWRFDPQIQSPVGFGHFEHMTCRGVSYYDEAAYSDAGAAAGAATPESPASSAEGGSASASTQAAESASSSVAASAAGRSSASGAVSGPAPQGASPAMAGNASGAAAAVATGAIGATQGASATAASATVAASASPASSAAASTASGTAEASGAVPAAAGGSGESGGSAGATRAPAQAAQAACPRRIFLPTADARLIALDADTGKVCDGFGTHGVVDLRANIGPFTAGGYYSTSPPMVTRNLVVIGGHVTDNESTNEPSGVMRAYDVHDGHLVWNWDAGRPDDTAPIAADKFYTRNSPNMWTVASVDERLGLIYLPMGNQTPDQWGGNRTPQAERFGAGVVALDLATGRVKWSYQFTHHDLWDMDVGGQPTLMDLQTASGVKPALLASTKQGSIYVLDRRTGAPLMPITETPVPQGAGKGDRTSPTQPVSALNFNPPRVHESDMWGATPYDQLWCRLEFRSLRYDGAFTPPSEKGTLVFPGNFGAFDWGGISVDPVRQILFANPNYMAFISRLIPRDKVPAVGHEHGSETSGIKQAKGAPYGIELNPFLSPLGVPCQAPPWGYVAGVDLTSGKIVWKHRNGTIRDSAPLPIPFKLGVPSLGGTIATAGGVGFLSGTLDYYLRAYDLSTGKQLWQARLPAGGQATPMTYADASGKQYVLVAAGGHGSLGTRTGDAVVAYTLP
ncbi:PQQ-binding-like beta-propeller repeat protein [Trinickia caryophylli]|uniref:Quinoprotein glucose dehydrogenase n=1 Tax=Trinickia caryophylli TaxID=28094 RepID=A0A1X7GIL9_TRICW|nr:PQQ-binding-like beta-propeller repeat protein [Trinickia caryophylli]WQE14777.1 PQQ-binding-like beta-propeller repeat protein [Trinickia caryophylli]GLU34977.1 hypothetical protein Busp01_48190 [Trinickia caryophylli]SMF70394.1 quinoprotein glucose dehydrogenase [Trinickia caryophylli]